MSGGEKSHPTHVPRRVSRMGFHGAAVGKRPRAELIHQRIRAGHLPVAPGCSRQVGRERRLLAGCRRSR
jgi:hypothetical protein